MAEPSVVNGLLAELDRDAPQHGPSPPQAPADVVPWSRRAIIGVLLLIAIGGFVASFVVATPTTVVARNQQIGPISSSPGIPKSVPIIGSNFDANLASFRIHLRFRIERLTPHATVFYVGTPSSGISAVASTPVDGFSSVVLASLDSAHPFSAVLVSRVVVGRTYAISISVFNDHSITAVMDGRLQFMYSDLNSDLIPRITGATIGAGPLLTSPVHGTVTNFSMTVQHLRVIGSPTLAVTLRAVSGLLFACVIVLCVIEFVTGRRVAGWLHLTQGGEAESVSRFGRLRKQWTLVGLALLTGGVATLALVTPIDNTVLQKYGEQHFSAAPVGSHSMTFYSLGGEPRLFKQAAALDVDLTFQIERNRPPSSFQGATLAVSTFGNGHGLMFLVAHTNGLSPLISWVGGDGTILAPIQRLLVPDLLLHQWVTISAVVQRSQSFRYLVDGSTVQTYTWNLPILNATPTGVGINGTFGGSIRDLTMNVTLYRVDPNRVPFFLVRLSQALALLAIVGSTILLSRRFLSRLIPVSHPHKPLVLVAFWTMGVGIALNLVIDLLRFQQSSNLYASRNSWLLSQYPRFNDFFQVYEILRSFNPYGIQNGTYPPFGYWLVAPFVWMNEYAALITMIGLTVGFIAWWSRRSFASGFPIYAQCLVIAVTLFSLPVSVAVDRANEDLIIFVLIVFGIAALERQRPALAATWIGIAAAAKIYPVAYLLVFLRGKRIRYILLGLCVILAATLLSVVGFHGSLMANVDGLKSAYSGLQAQLAGGVNATYYNASIPAWLQSIGYAVNGVHGLDSVRTAIQPFVLPVEGLVGLALAAYLRWHEQALWRAIVLITTFFLLFSDLSYYYELLFLFVALALFVKYASVNRRALVIAALFGLVMAPRAYFYLGNTMIDVSVLTTAPLLIGLTVVVIYDGYRERASARSIRNAEVPVELSLRPIDA